MRLHCGIEETLARYVEQARKCDADFARRRAEVEPGVSMAGFGLFEYLAQDAPLELIPDEIMSSIGEDAMNAAYDTGVDGVTDFCRQLVPVIEAIRAMP